MESLLPILADVSKVIGVPAAICLAWAAFVIRDHSRRIKILEDSMDAAATKRADELNKLYDRINAMASDVAFIKGQLASNAKARTNNT